MCRRFLYLAIKSLFRGNFYLATKSVFRRNYYFVTKNYLANNNGMVITVLNNMFLSSSALELLVRNMNSKKFMH